MGMGADPVVAPESMTPAKKKAFEDAAAAGSGVEGATEPYTTGAMRPGETSATREAERLGKTDKLDPTLTDLLLRDIATGQVRRTRAGARRATFGGSSMNPYDTPTLGG